jgi:hypothetical protein
MSEVTGPQAAEIIGASLQTIHRRVDDGSLRAREQGAGSRKTPYIEIDDLRQFATTYGYRFNEALAKQFTE